MAVDFELTSKQKELKYSAREFAREVLRPVASNADAQVDPNMAFRLMKPVYEEFVGSGLSTMFLPPEYGGAGASTVDFLIVVEELCAVDPGFSTMVMVNGLALMPILWFGSEEQREKWLRLATTDPTKSFLAGFALSERGGAANFDNSSQDNGVQVVADYDAATGEYVLQGEKHWPCNAGGWDLDGADVTLCVVRTDRGAAGREGGLSAILVERGTPNVAYEVIDTMAQRTCQNVTMTFHGARVAEENILAAGQGDLLVNRAFSWSGPIAAIASVGLARGAYEFALGWARTYTGGGSFPIMHHQAVGHLLTDIAARIEAGRYFAWKAAHYMDMHPGEGHGLAGMNKAFCTDLMQNVVTDCMRLVGVNALDQKFPLARFFRESAVFSLYDAGNVGMQRRRSWGVMTDRGFSPDTFVDDNSLPFTRSMEGWGTSAY